MILREAGLVEIYDRIFAVKDTLGLKAFKRTPTKPIDESKLPCIFMLEGVDDIIQYSARTATGYDCKRLLEVTLEIITNRDVDIKKLYRDVRSVVLAPTPTVADSTFIRELRTEGPTGYGLPDVTGIRLVLALSYNDDGT